MRKKNKGFTLMELLAVIIILGLLMFVGIPRITEIIDSSRRKTLVNTISQYINAAETSMIQGSFDGEADFGFEGAPLAGETTFDCQENSPEVLYFIPLDRIKLSKGGKNPYGEWIIERTKAGKTEYVSGVLGRYSEEGWKLGFQFLDKSGHFMTPKLASELTGNTKRLIQVKGEKTPAVSLNTNFGPKSYTVTTQDEAGKEVKETKELNSFKALCVAKAY